MNSTLTGCWEPTASSRNAKEGPVQLIIDWPAHIICWERHEGTGDFQAYDSYAKFMNLHSRSPEISPYFNWGFHARPKQNFDKLLIAGSTFLRRFLCQATRHTSSLSLHRHEQRQHAKRFWTWWIWNFDQDFRTMYCIFTARPWWITVGYLHMVCFYFLLDDLKQDHLIQAGLLDTSWYILIPHFDCICWSWRLLLELDHTLIQCQADQGLRALLLDVINDMRLQPPASQPSRPPKAPVFSEAPRGKQM